MKRLSFLFSILISLGLLFSPASSASALSIMHHFYNFSRNCVKVVASPIKGALIQGPKDIKSAYVGEVWEKEKEEDRGQWRYKLYGIWRAPGVEAKAIVDGLTESFTAAGSGIKELISIFWGD